MCVTSANDGAGANIVLSLPSRNEVFLIGGVYANLAPNVVSTRPIQSSVAKQEDQKKIEVSFSAHGLPNKGVQLESDHSSSEGDNNHKNESAGARGFGSRLSFPGELVAVLYPDLITAGTTCEVPFHATVQRVDTGSIVWAVKLPSPAEVLPISSVVEPAPTPARRPPRGKTASTPSAAAPVGEPSAKTPPCVFLLNPNTLFLTHPQTGRVIVGSRSDVVVRSRAANKKFREFVAVGKQVPPLTSEKEDALQIIAFSSWPADAKCVLCLVKNLRVSSPADSPFSLGLIEKEGQSWSSTLLSIPGLSPSSQAAQQDASLPPPKISAAFVTIPGQGLAQNVLVTLILEGILHVITLQSSAFSGEPSSKNAMECITLDSPFAVTECSCVGSDGILVASGHRTAACTVEATPSQSVKKGSASSKKGKIVAAAKDFSRSAFIQYFTLIPVVAGQATPEPAQATTNKKGSVKKNTQPVAVAQRTVSFLSSAVIPLPPTDSAGYSVLSADAAGPRHLLAFHDASQSVIRTFVVSLSQGPPAAAQFADVFSGTAIADDDGLMSIRPLNLIRLGGGQPSSVGMLYPTVATRQDVLVAAGAKPDVVITFEVSGAHQTHSALARQWHNAARAFSLLVKTAPEAVFSTQKSGATAPWSTDVVDAAVAAFLSANEAELLFEAAVRQISAMHGCDIGALAAALVVARRVEALGLDLSPNAVSTLASFLVETRSSGHDLRKCGARLAVIASPADGVSGDDGPSPQLSIQRRYPSTAWVSTLLQQMEQTGLSRAHASDVLGQGKNLLDKVASSCGPALDKRVTRHSRNAVSGLAAYEAPLLLTSQ